MSEAGSACLSDPVEDWVAEELSAGRAVQLKVLGGSMRPWLLSGERVVISPLPASALRLGHVVALWDPDAPPGQRLAPLHRVVYLNAEQVITKGDALMMLDDVRARELVLGRVTAISPSSAERSPLPLRRLRALLGLSPFCPVALAGSAAVSGARALVSLLKRAR